MRFLKDPSGRGGWPPAGDSEEVKKWLETGCVRKVNLLCRDPGCHPGLQRDCLCLLPPEGLCPCTSLNWNVLPLTIHAALCHSKSHSESLCQ